VSDQPGYQRGDRIALEHTTDPYTRLKPGDQGTVTGYDPRHSQLAVAWDNGSTLAMLLADGDQVRLLTPAQHQATPRPGPPHPATANEYPNLEGGEPA
jgi:Domain of unknown function (DUF4314)